MAGYQKRFFRRGMHGRTPADLAIRDAAPVGARSIKDGQRPHDPRAVIGPKPHVTMHMRLRNIDAKLMSCPKTGLIGYDNTIYAYCLYNIRPFFVLMPILWLVIMV
ncbi:hypothetical protein Apmu_0246_02 [Acidiphilium multivorum AIU301]|nr:hypothetical protein Apmu_0246_02 [Acidiphilium multivorum AIU301]